MPKATGKGKGMASTSGRPVRACTQKPMSTHDEDKTSDDDDDFVSPSKIAKKSETPAKKRSKNDPGTSMEPIESDAHSTTSKIPPKKKSKNNIEPEEDVASAKKSEHSAKKRSKNDPGTTTEPKKDLSGTKKSENSAKKKSKNDPGTSAEPKENVPTAKKSENLKKQSKPLAEKKSDNAKESEKSKVKEKTSPETTKEIEFPKFEQFSNRSRPSLSFNLAGTVANFSFSSSYEIERRSRAAVVEQISQFRVFKSVTPFDRRVTAIAWHPKEPTLCAVGSKGGDLLLWNYHRDEFQSLLTGIGAGGSIQGLKFDTENSNRVYTCSIDGTFAAKDFGGDQANIFLDTNDWEKWYTSFDVSNVGGTLMVGDNNGFVTLLTKSGELVWRYRLHKSKVTNIQFSPREPWLVITTSVDNTVKVWDIRALSTSNSTSPKSGKTNNDRKTQWLYSLEHDKAVNSAYFSPLDGTRLLTTDQHSQLRVYRAPFWTLERTIPHPHRQFQHLTPIRGTWHPLIDMAVVGRYPDEKFRDFVPGELRTIDCIDADTGTNLLKLHEPGLNKISSLNQFSRSGDALLSGMGQSILIWKAKPEDSDAMAYQSKASNLKDLTVEEWPGYKPPPKNSKSKKLKVVEDVD